MKIFRNIEDIKGIFSKNGWYTLYIPRDDLLLSDFSVFDRVYEIIIALLKKYCEKFYTYKKAKGIFLWLFFQFHISISLTISIL